jgi:hypothetical protein
MSDVLVVGVESKYADSVSWEDLTPDAIADASSILLDLRTLPVGYDPGPRWAALVRADRFEVPFAVIVACPGEADVVFDVLPYHIRSVPRRGETLRLVCDDPLFVGYSAFIDHHDFVITADAYKPAIVTRGDEMICGMTGNRISLFHPPSPKHESDALSHVISHLRTQPEADVPGVPPDLATWVAELPGLDDLIAKRKQALDSGDAEALVAADTELRGLVVWTDIVLLGDDALRVRVGGALRAMGLCVRFDPDGVLGPDWRLDGESVLFGATAGARGRTAADTADRLVRWAGETNATGVLVGHTGEVPRSESLSPSARRSVLSTGLVDEAISRGLAVLSTHVLAAETIAALISTSPDRHGAEFASRVAASRGAVIGVSQ